MQYSYTITIREREMIALRDAIKVYKEFVHSKIGDEIKAPYWARLQSIKSIENKMTEQIVEAVRATEEFINSVENFK
jgi:hypothetical protein